MAPKRSTPPPPPLPLPPPVASSEETASGSDSEESEEEEESPVAQPAPVVSNKGEESESSGEEESDEEEEEEEEEEDLLRSSATKSRAPPQENRDEEDDSSDEEEGESSESDKAAPPPLPNPAPKQGAEGNGPKVSSPKRQAFHRIWSTEDEVRILEALAAHRREHGSLPQTDALIATLAGSLDNTGYGRKELQGKVSTLKRRYESTAKKKGDLPSKGHDRRLYDLSKSVWGSEAAATANGTEPREFSQMCEMYPHLAEEVKVLEAAHPGLFKRDFGRLDDDKAHALDMKIKKQRIAEISVVLRRGDLTKEVTKVLTELVE